MRLHALFVILVAFSTAGLTACGGSKPPAEEPKAEEPKSEESKDDAKKDDDKSDADKKDDAKSDKSTAPTSATSGPAVTRTPKDIITAPDVTFMFSFNESEPKEKADEKCRAQSKDDPKKMAACMTKERGKFQADGMQFKKNDRGEWVWMTLRRKGNTLTYLHKIAFDFGEEKETSITLKLTGKDTGKAPFGKVPSQVTFEVPNEFQIIVKDPEHGRLVYEAKIGITSEDGKASGAMTR